MYFGIGVQAAVCQDCKLVIKVGGLPQVTEGSDRWDNADREITRQINGRW